MKSAVDDILNSLNPVPYEKVPRDDGRTASTLQGILLRSPRAASGNDHRAKGRRGRRGAVAGGVLAVAVVTVGWHAADAGWLGNAVQFWDGAGQFHAESPRVVAHGLNGAGLPLTMVESPNKPAGQCVFITQQNHDAFTRCSTTARESLHRVSASTPMPYVSTRPGGIGFQYAYGKVDPRVINRIVLVGGDHFTRSITIDRHTGYWVTSFPGAHKAIQIEGLNRAGRVVASSPLKVSNK